MRKMTRGYVVFLVLFGSIATTESENPDKCPVSLPQKSPTKCKLIREQRLVQQRAIYQIKPPTPGGIQPPLLNMTAARLIEVFGNDAHLKYHLRLYLQMAGFNTKLLALWAKVNNGTPIEKIEDYKKIFYFFLSRQEPFGGKQFRTPSAEEPFPDVMSKWNNDQVFSERRLAGTNPMTLQRVYKDKPDGSCNAETCGYGGTCLKNGRCRCSRRHTGPNAKKVGALIEADDCKTRCKFNWFDWDWKCPQNVPPRAGMQGLKWSSLQKLLNPKFDWDAAVEKALGTKDTLKSAVEKGYIYALRYPLCDRVVNVYPDLSEPNPKRKVWPFNSPIALFVSKPSVYISSDETTARNGKESDDRAATEKELENQDYVVDTEDQESVADVGEKYEGNSRAEQIEPVKRDQDMTAEDHTVDEDKHESQLRPVAIQMDFLPNSTVHTPADGDLWTLAKLNLEVTDYGYNQIVEHLLKVHLLMEPFCVVLPRHLSEDHPLHQILKFHCLGIMVTNAIGAPTLLLPAQFTHQLLAFGHRGSNQLVNLGYVEAGWHETDFKNNIKKRGLDDRHSLPYFPYRDDGEVMYDEIEAMVTDYIHTYYLNDEDVKKDNELQRYVNEISADGKGPDGGRGMMKGFPATVKTRMVLVNIITRLIAQVTIQHTAVNYPLIDYAGVTSLTPTKLYSDPRVKPGEFSVFNFPNANTAAVQGSLTVNLATLRYDSLFNYSGKLRDQQGREVVDRHFCRLRRVIQPLLEDRNEKRFQGGQLTYPYFLPRWVPNGVQT